MKAKPGDPVMIIRGDNIAQVVQVQEGQSVMLTPGGAYLHRYMKGEIV